MTTDTGATRAGVAPRAGGLSRPGPAPVPRPRWPAVAVGSLAAAGFALFFASLRHVELNRMNGLGLLSVLPPGAVAGVTVLAGAFVAGITLPRAYRGVLGAMLAALVICLDGMTAFIEPAPRFATSYQIAGYIEYISANGHAAPSLAAYFSWPGFFALLSLLRGAAGVHSVLTLMRVWPMLIGLLCLPPFFLFMRSLRISWRAQWLAGFLFVVGNWVGQDYFSPQSLNYVLYLVFLAILVNWFTDPGLSRPPRPHPAGLARLHRWTFGLLSPGERPPRLASRAQRGYLLALLIGIAAVSTMSHQLTPFYLTGACLALVLIRRCPLPGLWLLLAVMVVIWVNFAAVDYWSGHLGNIFGGVGNLGGNLTSSVGGRLAGSTATHLLTLHARVAMAGAIAGLAVLGLLRRRFGGFDDRVLIALFVLPMLTVGLQSYGGEIALRIYLFLLPPACVLAACFFFPRSAPGRPGWWTLPVLALCAALFPTCFILVRYGNEAFEQTPRSELAATDWIYAHDGHGARLLWLSSSTKIDVTPEMPWSYRDISRVLYVPVQAPRDPAQVSGVLAALRSAGPDSYLLQTRTQDSYLQQAAGYRAGWETRFREQLRAARGVRVVFASPDAVIYTLHWPAGARGHPIPAAADHARYPVLLGAAELIVVLALMTVLAAREFARLGGPATQRFIPPLTLASYPLLVLTAAVVVVRFALLPSIHGGLL
jgi:hypothetical protein